MSQERDLTPFHQRWAILVGVSVYSDSAIEPLEAPANDVKNMRNLLTKRGGFSDEHIIVLTDSQATYQGINKAFQSLLDKVKPNDLVVFYFSGRGTRVKNNIFPEDEQQDGLDECFLPYDAVRKTKEHFLRDDEIGRYLQRLNPQRAVIIIDSCYSGTSDGEKGIITDGVHMENKYLDGITQTDFLPSGSIVFEACYPEETINDGIFTDLLTQFVESESAKDDGIVTLYEIYQHVKEQIKPLAPQLVGKDDAKNLSIVQPLLEVRSEPLNVEIFIDNKPVEAVRTEDSNILILPKGSYRIELRKRGYNIWDNKNSKIEIKNPGRLPINAGTLTQVSIKGRIIYEKSRLPVHRAKVAITYMTYETTTDKNGEFVFNDWSKYGPLQGQLEILISGEGIEAKSIEKADVGEFNEDISFGEIEVTRLVKISLAVKKKNVTEKKLSDAQVLIGGKQVVADNEGIFKIDIINPDENIQIEVSRQGYDTKQESIPIGDANSYSTEIQLEPAEHLYSIEVKSQYGEPISDVVVKLNGTQIVDKTGQDGIVKGKTRVVLDELQKIEISRDGRVDDISDFKKPEFNDENIYEILVVMKALQITVETIDLANAPIADVQILVDNKNTTKMSDNGQARLSLIKKTGDEVKLTFEAEWDSQSARMNVIIKVLGETNFELVSPKEKVTQVGEKLVVKLPIPPLVSIKINVTDEKGVPLPGMIVQLDNITFPSTTDSEGVIEIQHRLKENTALKLTFEKYGNKYDPQGDIKPTRISPNEYKATAVLPIQLCVIDINAHANIGNSTIKKMAIYAEILLDGEQRGELLPLSIENILPGKHELKITIMDKPTVKFIKIDSGERVSEDIEIDEEIAWRLCMNLLQNPSLQTTETLETARQISQELGRTDFAQLFEQRKRSVR